MEDNYKTQAKRSQAEKLAKYRAHGGRVSDEWENSKKDKILDAAEKKVGIKEGGKTDEAIDKAAMKNRAIGGPIAGDSGSKPKLGRNRKGSKTNVNVIVAGKPGGSDAPAGAPAPALPMPSPSPAGIPGGKPPLPISPGAAPMKKGGAAKSKKKDKC